MSDSREFTENISRVAKRLCDNCKDCGGHGMWPVTYPSMSKPRDGFDRPCPTCADLRKLAKMCWHEIGIDGMHSNEFCKKCYKNKQDCTNPTYTIETIVQYMQILGVWEGLRGYIDTLADRFSADSINYYYDYDILTTPSLLIQACNSYLKEVCDAIH